MNMKLAANKKNLKTHAKLLLGVNYTSENEQKLIALALTGFERTHGHISHDLAAHLEKLNSLLGTYGVEGMLLDWRGEDISGLGYMRDVKWDIQYCNAGDTYTTTLIYVNRKLYIGDWGSIVEKL